MLSGISLPHILLLLMIVILVFGTSKLKNLGKDLGGAIKGFKESMKGEDDASGTPPAPPAQLNQQQTPPAQGTSQQASHNEPRQGQ